MRKPLDDSMRPIECSHEKVGPQPDPRQPQKPFFFFFPALRRPSHEKQSSRKQQVGKGRDKDEKYFRCHSNQRPAINKYLVPTYYPRIDRGSQAFCTLYFVLSTLYVPLYFQNSEGFKRESCPGNGEGKTGIAESNKNENTLT